MRRREFITVLGGAAAWPLAARAQQAGRIARVGVLGPDLNNSVTGPGYQVFLSELRKLGFTEGQNLVVEHRRTDEGLPKAFTGANEMVAAKVDVLVANGPEIALQVLSSPVFNPHRAPIAELAIGHRLPTMFIFRTYVEAGGLMSYGVDTRPMWRRAASYVAKILRGAQPADLPVEQAANFEFALNLKTAKAIGVTLPTSILLRADEVIE